VVPTTESVEQREAEVVPAAEPASFTFTLSSGGVETVSGSGLLGRRPAPQPGEEVGVLIAFVDPGRSVSKTHLEFGVEGDNLWICDRYSANGTVLRAPGGVARLCEPGRRYRVTRESRIEIGEQYIDVT
jgi:FHA domain